MKVYFQDKTGEFGILDLKSDLQTSLKKINNMFGQAVQLEIDPNIEILSQGYDGETYYMEAK